MSIFPGIRVFALCKKEIPPQKGREAVPCKDNSIHYDYML